MRSFTAGVGAPGNDADLHYKQRRKSHRVAMNRFWLKGCRVCGGDLYVVPDVETDGYELKCIQCGRVFGDVSRGRLVTSPPLDIERESKPVGGVRTTVSARRTFDHLLSKDEKKRGVAFRLSRNGSDLEVERGETKPDDVVIQYHRHPVLALGAETLDLLGGTTIEAKDGAGRTTIVIRQPHHRGYKSTNSREIVFA